MSAPLTDAEAALLTAYASGPRALTTAEQASVQALLARSPEARRELEAARAMVSALRALPVEGTEPAWAAMSSSIAAACAAAAAGPAPASVASRMRRWLWPGVGVGVAVAATATVALLWLRPDATPPVAMDEAAAKDAGLGEAPPDVRTADEARPAWPVAVGAISIDDLDDDAVAALLAEDADALIVERDRGASDHADEDEDEFSLPALAESDIDTALADDVVVVAEQLLDDNSDDDDADGDAGDAGDGEPVAEWVDDVPAAGPGVFTQPDVAGWLDELSDDQLEALDLYLEDAG